MLRPRGIFRYFEAVFLGVWLTGWTVGGVMAWRKLLRDLSGADCIRLAAAGLELTRRAGPFARTLQFDRAHMRRIRIRSHDKALVVDTIAGTQVLTDLGTASERESLCAWLRHRLSMEYHLQFGPLLKERRFDDGQLEVTHTRDSDGDSRYRLIVRDASKNRTFDSSLYDDAELVDCARWLEASTGFPLRLPR